MKTFGAYTPGHEKPSVAQRYRKHKAATIAAIRKQKAARVSLPPHHGRGAGQPVGEKISIPTGPAPHFGRGAK